MRNLITKLQDSLIGRLYFGAATFSSHHLFPMIVLIMRIWMARIFWYSGLTKITNWETTVYLFEYEYAVPIIPADIAAFLATTAELGAPAFLLFGFMTRLAAIPMLFMTAVIQFTYLDLNEHFYWAMLLGTIILYGPGRYSLDRLLVGKGKHCSR